MSIATPIDVMTPAVRRRQQLAASLQQQYAQNKGTQKQMQHLNSSALHALPLFGGSGYRDSANLPAAPLPQLTVPFMQSPGVRQGLGVVNPASPDAPTSSQGPGQAAPGFAPSGAPGLGVTRTTVPGTNVPSADAPQAGDGRYADGSAAAQPIIDPNQLLRLFGPMAARMLFGNGDQFGPNSAQRPGPGVGA